jgi:hypothetical protein
MTTGMPLARYPGKHNSKGSIVNLRSFAVNIVHLIFLTCLLTTITTLAAEPKSWSYMSYSEKNAAARNGLGIQVTEYTDTRWGRTYKLGAVVFKHSQLHETGEYVRITGVQIFPQFKSATMTFMPFAVQFTPLDSNVLGTWSGELPDLLWPMESWRGIKAGAQALGIWNADSPLGAKSAGMRILEVFDGPYFIVQNTDTGEIRLFRSNQFSGRFASSDLNGCGIFGGR